MKTAEEFVTFQQKMRASGLGIMQFIRQEKINHFHVLKMETLIYGVKVYVPVGMESSAVKLITSYSYSHVLPKWYNALFSLSGEDGYAKGMRSLCGIIQELNFNLRSISGNEVHDKIL